VLTSGTFIGALSFAILGASHAAWSCVLVAVPAGVAMAMSLYDTCFAALWQQFPSTYRRSVTFVTLVAGLASTVFWPTTHFLLRVLSWRSTCWIFAALLVVATGINWLTFSHPRVASQPLISDASERSHPHCGVGRARGLVVAFAGVSFVGAALSAHLPATLHAMRLEPRLSIWIASSVGVMQVVGRALEFSAGGALPARKLGLVTFVAVLVALLVLLASAGTPSLALAFAVIYGAANGVLTVVGAILPRELFGTAELGAVLGRFAAPSRVARALGPWAFSVAAATVGSWGALVCIAGIAALSLATYVMTVPASKSACTRTTCDVHSRCTCSELSADAVPQDSAARERDAALP
jgi:hypothetical protein